MSTGYGFVTKLGDVVHVRFDDDGNEHITVATRGTAIAVPPELAVVPEPSGLDAFSKYRRSKS